MLEKRVVTSVGSNNQASSTTYIAIRINDSSAIDDYSQISIQFNDYFSSINLDFANVLNADGKTSAIREDAIQIKSQSSENFYVDSKVLAFSLPAIQIGALLEFQYTISHKRSIIENEFFNTESFNHWEQKANPRNYRLDYVHFSEYVLALPNTQSIKVFTPNNFSTDYQKIEVEAVTTHRWQMKNIDSIRLERYIPNDYELSPYIDITTIGNWNNVVTWADALFSPTIENNTAIQKIAQNIVLQHSDTESQIRAVFDYMQDNIRYVFAHVGRGGFTPHKANEVITNGYGDCKDQTVLTISILRALGIEAYPALVATTGTNEPNSKIPRSQFDHMITYIPEQKGAEERWLDTVGGNYLFPGISHYVNKRSALIIQPETKKLRTINNTLNADNKIDIDFYYARKDQNIFSAKFTANFKGEIESEFRNWIRYAEDKETAVKNLFLQLYPNSTIEDVEINNANDKKDTLNFTGTYLLSAEPSSKKSPYRIGLNSARLANIFSFIPQLDPPNNRHYPMSINNSFKLSITSTIDKPKHYVLKNSGELIFDKSNIAYAYSHAIIDSPEADNIKVNQVITFNTFEVSQTEYKNIYDIYQEMDDIFWLVNLEHDKNESTIASLKNNTKTADEYVTLIQAFVDNGDYQEAIKFSEKALKKYPNEGNIFYLKGLAHAYNGDDSAADKAFNKSEELGYDI